MTELIPFPELAARLDELTGNPGPGYRKTYMLAVDGTLPTVRVRGRRFVRDEDLPKVLELLGLTITPAAASSLQRERTRASKRRQASETTA